MAEVSRKMNRKLSGQSWYLRFQKLNKRGTMMIVIILFLLLFSTVAVTLELSLLQRVEGKRYAERNNGIYTADAMMDMYIYATGAVISSPGKPYTAGPLLNEDRFDDFATEMGESISKSFPGGKRLNLKDIYEIVGLTTLDKPEMTEMLLGVMYDQVQIDNTLINSTPFQIDWENPETVCNGDEEDIFVLRPIRVKFKEYFKSYTVEKIVSFNNVFLQPAGEYPSFTLEVNTDSMEMLVEEYNCYE